MHNKTASSGPGSLMFCKIYCFFTPIHLRLCCSWNRLKILLSDHAYFFTCFSLFNSLGIISNVCVNTWTSYMTVYLQFFLNHCCCNNDGGCWICVFYFIGEVSSSDINFSCWHQFFGTRLAWFAIPLQCIFPLRVSLYVSFMKNSLIWTCAYICRTFVLDTLGARFAGLVL